MNESLFARDVGPLCDLKRWVSKSPQATKFCFLPGCNLQHQTCSVCQPYDAWTSTPRIPQPAILRLLRSTHTVCNCFNRSRPLKKSRNFCAAGGRPFFSLSEPFTRPDVQVSLRLKADMPCLARKRLQSGLACSCLVAPDMGKHGGWEGGHFQGTRPRCLLLISRSSH